MVYQPLACCICGNTVFAAGHQFCSTCYKKWVKDKPMTGWLHWLKCQSKRERYRWKRDLARTTSLEAYAARQEAGFAQAES